MQIAAIETVGLLQNKAALPDLVVKGVSRREPVYAVRFEPTDIWGELAEPGAVIYTDLYEAYLEPALEDKQ